MKEFKEALCAQAESTVEAYVWRGGCPLTVRGRLWPYSVWAAFRPKMRR